MLTCAAAPGRPAYLLQAGLTYLYPDEVEAIEKAEATEEIRLQAFLEVSDTYSNAAYDKGDALNMLVDRLCVDPKVVLPLVPPLVLP